MAGTLERTTLEAIKLATAGFGLVCPHNGDGEYVYAVRDAVGRTKVGHSGDVASRLSSIRTDNPGTSLVAAWGPTERALALTLEGLMHSLLQPVNIWGEWYYAMDTVLSTAAATAMGECDGYL